MLRIRRSGSTITMPFCVLNQSLPSRARKPPGCPATLEASLVFIPSGGPIELGCDARKPPIRKVIQVLPMSRVNTARGTDPEVLLIVSQNGRRVVIKEPALRRVAGNSPVADAESRQSGDSSTQPETSVLIVKYRSDRKIDPDLTSLVWRFSCGKFE